MTRSNIPKTTILKLDSSLPSRSLFFDYIYIYVVTGQRQLLSYLSFDVYQQVIRKMIGGTLVLAPFRSVRWYNICHLIDFFQCHLLVVLLKHLFPCTTPPISCDLMVCLLLHHFTSIYCNNIGNSNEIEQLLENMSNNMKELFDDKY